MALKVVNPILIKFDKRKEGPMKKNLPAYMFVLFILLFSVFCVPQSRAEYPEKPIEIIVHSSPGGGTDLFSRQVALILEKEGIVKQKINVVNKSGGGGTIANNYLATKKGDLYTLMGASTTPLTALMRETSRIKFDDITLIAMLIEDDNFAFTRYDSPYKDMKSLIEAAKKAPKIINVAIGNIGSSEHICAYRVEKAAGVAFNIISFKGGGESAAALLGGHVDFSFGSINEQMGQIEAKKMRALAIMSEQKIPYLPNVPTMKELGINATFTQIRGFWAPQDFPPYAVKFWEDAFAKLMKTKSFKDLMASTQGREAFLKHEEFKKFLVPYYDDLKKDVLQLEAYKEKK